MIADLLPSLKALNDRCGYNFALQRKKEEAFGQRPAVPEINLAFRPKATEVISETTRQISDITRLRSEFKTQNDSSKQEALKRSISALFDKVNSGINRLSNLLGLVEQDLERQKKDLGDPDCRDARNRILSGLLSLLRKRFFKLVNTFNQLQSDVKTTYKEKLERQLRVYQKDLSDEEIKGLMADPEKMNKFVMVHMYGQRKGLENAVNDIDEKLAEIKELEQNMIKLHAMIVTLRKIVQQQNQTLDSIAGTLTNIEDVVMRTQKELEAGKSYHVSAKEVG